MKQYFFDSKVLIFIPRLLVDEIIPALRNELTEEEFDVMIYQHDGSTIQWVE